MHVTPFDIVRPLCTSDQQALGLLAADSSDSRFAEFRDAPHKNYEYNDLLSLKNSTARAYGIFAIAAKQLSQRKECKDDMSLQFLREKIRHYLSNNSIEKKYDVLKYIKTPFEWFFITDCLGLDPKSSSADKDFIVQYAGVIFVVAQHLTLPGFKCSHSAIDNNERMLKQLAASDHAGNSVKVDLLLELQNTNNMLEVLDCFVAAFEKDRNVRVVPFWNRVMTTTVLKDLFADIEDLPDVNERDRYLLVLTYFLMRHSGKSRDHISPDLCKCNPVVFACAQQLSILSDLRQMNTALQCQIANGVACLNEPKDGFVNKRTALIDKINAEVVDDLDREWLVTEVSEVGNIQAAALITLDIPKFPVNSWDNYQSCLQALTSSEDKCRQGLERDVDRLDIKKLESRIDLRLNSQKQNVVEDVERMRAAIKKEYADANDLQIEDELRGRLQQRVKELTANHKEFLSKNEELRSRIENIESERQNYGDIAARPKYYLDEKYEHTFSSSDIYCLCSFANKMAKIVEACGSKHDRLLLEEQIWESKVEECSREAAGLKSGIADLRRQAQAVIELNPELGETLDRKVGKLPKNASEQYMMKGVWSDKLFSIGSIENHDIKKIENLKKMRGNLLKLVGDLREYNDKFIKASGDVDAVAKSIVDRQACLQSVIGHFSDKVMQDERGGLNKLMVELLRSRHKQQNFSRLRFRKFDYGNVDAVTVAVNAIIAKGHKKSLSARVLRLPRRSGKEQKQQQILQALQVVNSVVDVFAKLDLENLSYEDKVLSLASIFGACHSLGAQLDAIKLLPQHDEIVVVFKKHADDLEKRLNQFGKSDVAVEAARMKIFTRDKTVVGDSSKYILQCCGAECGSSQCDGSAAKKTSFAILQLPGVEGSSPMQVVVPSVDTQKARESRASSRSGGGMPSTAESSVFEGEIFSRSPEF